MIVYCAPILQQQSEQSPAPEEAEDDDLDVSPEELGVHHVTKYVD